MMWCIHPAPGNHNKIPQAGWPKQQIFILSQLWRLKVLNQGQQQGSWLLSQGLSPWLADSCLLPVSSYNGLSSMCDIPGISLCVQTSSFFWSHDKACGILAPHSGMEPVSLAWVLILTTEGSPSKFLLIMRTPIR